MFRHSKAILARGAITAFALLSITGAGVLAQDSSWLDQPLYWWNQPGDYVPVAPELGYNTGDCESVVPATAEQQTVSDAGWLPVGSVMRSEHVAIVYGTTDFDGMCRPMGYQAFVFVDQVYAGTISPVTMASRYDGAGSIKGFTDQTVTARFSRYSPQDPACCPHDVLDVFYRIVGTSDGPVLRPIQSAEDPDV